MFRTAVEAAIAIGEAQSGRYGNPRNVEAKRRREAKAAKAKAKAKDKSRIWLGERDDFAGARSSMASFARCSILAGMGKEPRATLLVALNQISSDLQQKIFWHLKDTEFKSFEEFKERFMDFLLYDDTLFGKRFSENADEVYKFLGTKICEDVRHSDVPHTQGVEPMEGENAHHEAGLEYGDNGPEIAADNMAFQVATQIAAAEQPATKLIERDVLAIRLIEYANHKGWLENLARVLAKDAKLSAQIDRAVTFSDVCEVFDKTMKKRPGGLLLWSLSSNRNANMVIFKNNMSRTMKVRFPESKYAVRVVELANEKGILMDLAVYVANRIKAAEDDDDEGDPDMPNMSGN
jgi:hypothetical protein